MVILWSNYYSKMEKMENILVNFEWFFVPHLTIKMENKLKCFKNILILALNKKFTMATYVIIIKN